MSELQDDLARRAPQPSGPDAGHHDAEHYARDIEAVGRLDTARRAAVLQGLQSGPGNAAVQRLLTQSDEGGSDPGPDRAAVQRELEDEEMPDEAAAG
jgi:hypothetical protein